MSPSPHQARPATALGRRRFLGAVGLGLAARLVAGCGDGPTTGTAAPEIVGLFSTDRVVVAGRPQRLPFALVEPDGPDRGDLAELAVTVRSGDEIVDRLTVTGRVVEHDHVGTPEPGHSHSDFLRYYPLRAEFPRPGVFDLEVDLGDGAVGRLPVQAFATDDVTVLGPGQPMPAIVSATTGRPAGVDTLCTRAPTPCPFHELGIDEAVTAGRPLAVLVTSPALCATAYCGAVLETLIVAAPARPGLAVVHLEVYVNADEIAGNLADPRLERAPAVVELGLDFEPALFVVDGEATVVDRLDAIYDRRELDAVLDAVVGRR
ncbi:MAG: hypothetical protein ACFCVK_16950 [Acidimicrobiales bacterium]